METVREQGRAPGPVVDALQRSPVYTLRFGQSKSKLCTLHVPYKGPTERAALVEWETGKPPVTDVRDQTGWKPSNLYTVPISCQPPGSA